MTETPVKPSTNVEAIKNLNDDCLPCQALKKLCEILPEEDGKKACEEVRIGLENDTMTAEQARDLLATKVGKVVLATKLSEVSSWIEEQYKKREESKAQIAKEIPLKVEPKEEEVTKLPPMPEELTKPLDEVIKTPIAPVVEPSKKWKPLDVDEEEEPLTGDDRILYRDLDTTSIEDDPAYVWDDTDLWIEDGLEADDWED
jgi:hypothetical protein